MRVAARAAAAYAAVAAVLWAPLIDYAHLGTATFATDGRLIVWAIGWFAHVLRTGVPFFDANFFYPAPAALTHTEHMAGLGLAALPVTLTTGNAVLAFTVLQFLAPVLNGTAAFAVLRAHGLRPLPSWCGGLAAAFPFVLFHHYIHLQLICAWGIPLGVWLLDHWWDRGEARLLAAFALVVTWQALVSWYLAVLCAGVMAFRALWLMVTSSSRLATRVPWLGITALAVGAALLPFARPYAGMTSGPAAQVRPNSADLASWVVPPQNTWMGQWLMTHGSTAPRWIWGEQTLYLGASVAVLSLLGVMALARRGRELPRARLAWFPLLAVAGVALSFGPSLPGEPWRPWDPIGALPGLSGMRAPARFGLLVPFALAPLVGLGADALLRRRTIGRVALGLLVALQLSEVYVVALPEGRPRVVLVPSPYDEAARRDAHALLVLPMYVDTTAWADESDYQFYTTRHWTPIANGLARTVPDTYRALAQAQDARALHGALRFYGIDYVVAHAARAAGSGVGVGDVLAAPELFPVVFRDGDDYLLAVTPAGR